MPVATIDDLVVKVNTLDTNTTALLAAVTSVKTTLQTATDGATGNAAASLASANASAASAAASLLKADASAGSAASALQIYSTAAAMNEALATAAAQSSAAQSAVASASSVLQQDLGAISAALHRSPNAIVGMCLYDTSKDSDGGAWVERMGNTSWMTEPLNGAWLPGGFATELAARQATGATTAAFYQSSVDGKFYAINKNLLLNTATLGTQTAWLAAGTYTLSGATGATGSVALTGSAAGTFTAPTPLTFAVAAAGNVTFTVTGSVTVAQCEPGSSVTVYAANTTARITEVFRGNKAKFPRLSAIVAEAGSVTIYDLTEPGRPMWMRGVLAGVYPLGGQFGTTAATIGCVAMISGSLVVGFGNYGISVFNFASDTCSRKTVSLSESAGQIAKRNVSQAWTVTNAPFIVNSAVNSVAMAVLPDAPFDAATGLQVPTIAVATAGGVSVIKQDGTVANITATDSANLSCRRIRLTGTELSFFNVPHASFGSNTIPTASVVVGGSLFNWFRKRYYHSTVAGPNPLGDSAAYVGNAHKDMTASVLGVSKFKENLESPAKGAVVYVAEKYNTGYMVGDIRRAFLCNTEVDVISATELVTNGAFDVDTTAWTPNSGTLSVAAGKLRVTANATGSAAFAEQLVPTVVGKTYFFAGVATPGTSTVYFDVRSPGTLALTGGVFVANSTSTRVLLRLNSTVVGDYGDFDGISIKEYSPDRSVKGGKASIYGSISKTAVGAASQLVAYSGFTAANYLQEPFSADLDMGTGDWRVSAWIKYLPTRVNLLTKTDQFAHADWVKNAGGSGVAPVVTDNFAVAPDSSTTAARLYFDRSVGVANTDFSRFTQVISSFPTQNTSVWLRSNTAATQTIEYANGGEITVVSVTTAWQKFLRTSSNKTDLTFLARGTTTAQIVDILIWHPQQEAGVTVNTYQRVNTAIDYAGSDCAIADRSAATGASLKLALQADKLIATAFDGTTTRTVTTPNAYSSGVFIKASANYSAGRLSIMVNGVEVASVVGASMLTMNNSAAVLTIGNSFALDSPFPGSIALLKIGATVPSNEQAQWMFGQEKQMFRDGAQITLPSANAVLDLSHDESQDKWVAVQATIESSFVGLVRTATTVPSAGSFSKTIAESGVKALARITTSPGVDIQIPAYGLREELVRRSEAAAKASKTLTVFDFDAVGFTAATTAGSNQLTTVASVVGTPYIGMGITGAGIPVNTTIIGINGATCTMSANATATGATIAMGQSTFTLPAGWTVTEVLSAGASKREGATKDFTRNYDGFRETTRFAVAPGSAAWVQLTAKKDA